jgi:hypothetical protein
MQAVVLSLLINYCNDTSFLARSVIIGIHLVVSSNCQLVLQGVRPTGKER